MEVGLATKLLFTAIEYLRRMIGCPSIGCEGKHVQ